MTKAERELLLKALEFYRDERKLSDLPQDDDYAYFDYNDDGTITYNSTDAIDANNMSRLISIFS
ncbi:hypothetical protein [Levilactobacillus brevis]|uniref:hypothetical protein n=1 Tax=Levilactobacillus brevis TaxID=1580 RepID=UPI000BE9B893|nr:hypothetical protein [Levilactobacillus brevis]MDM7552551.1 hypothetical protein [Levilactobacillus brevis]MDM7649298.1 hypothetical protein [Levilactobacillus brevis]